MLERRSNSPEEKASLGGQLCQQVQDERTIRRNCAERHIQPALMYDARMSDGGISFTTYQRLNGEAYQSARNKGRRRGLSAQAREEFLWREGFTFLYPEYESVKHLLDPYGYADPSMDGQDVQILERLDRQAEDTSEMKSPAEQAGHDQMTNAFEGSLDASVQYIGRIGSGMPLNPGGIMQMKKGDGKEPAMAETTEDRNVNFPSSQALLEYSTQQWLPAGKVAITTDLQENVFPMVYKPADPLGTESVKSLESSIEDNREQVIFISTQHGSARLSAQLDAGAEKSLIFQSVVKRVGLTTNVPPRNATFVGWSDDHIPIKGVLEVTFGFQTESDKQGLHSIALHVIEDEYQYLLPFRKPFDVILGVDALKQIGFPLEPTAPDTSSSTLSMPSSFKIDRQELSAPVGTAMSPPRLLQDYHPHQPVQPRSTKKTSWVDWQPHSDSIRAWCVQGRHTKDIVALLRARGFAVTYESQCCR